MDVLQWIAVIAVGAVVGSFLNVVIYRLPQRQSLIFPASHCFSCGHRLTLPDLVPVLSYLVLRGRCRHCGRRFSPRYALVEAFTAGLAGLAAWNFGLNVYAGIVFVACAALVVALFVDIRPTKTSGVKSQRKSCKPSPGEYSPTRPSPSVSATLLRSP